MKTNKVKELTHKQYEDLKEAVYTYPTKSKWGYNSREIEDLLEAFEVDDTKRYYNLLGVNTGVIDDGESITYFTDILTALRAYKENRDLHPYEWD
jgi:hypothetical protein